MTNLQLFKLKELHYISWFSSFGGFDMLEKLTLENVLEYGTLEDIGGLQVFFPKTKLPFNMMYAFFNMRPGILYSVLLGLIEKDPSKIDLALANIDANENMLIDGTGTWP